MEGFMEIRILGKLTELEMLARKKMKKKRFYFIDIFPVK